jgi:uncharacterized cupin superfamily protein
MNEIIHASKAQITPMHQNVHPPYEFFRYEVAGFAAGNQCIVSIYDLPPGKSNFPYHYHTANEEIFYIISGTGVFKTPSGDTCVKAGDVIIFPPSDKGAHKLTNTSETETLTYLDVDTMHQPEVVFYPDSGKVGVFGAGIREVFMKDSRVDYYRGE